MSMKKHLLKITSGLVVLASVVEAMSQAEGYITQSVNEQGTRTVIQFQGGDLAVGNILQFRDQYDEVCYGQVVKVEGQKAVLDISKCKNNKEIKKGAAFEKSHRTMLPEEPTKPAHAAPKPSSGPTLDEDWYTLWGFGFSSIRYQDDDVQNALNDLKDTPGVDHTAVNVDVLGFYWPFADRKSMQGFIINSVSDSYTSDAGDLTVSQALYAYSYHRFYGANIGDGWFWRGDVGLAIHTMSVEVAGVSLRTRRIRVLDFLVVAAMRGGLVLKPGCWRVCTSRTERPMT